MWSKSIRQLTFNGTVSVSVGSTSPALPLRGVLVDVYRVERAADGNFQFQRLNQAAALTSTTGDFSFAGVSVPVESQEITLAEPPYTPFEYVNPASLPTLVFRISVDAEVLSITSVVEGKQIVEVYDERNDVDDAWILNHPERVHIALTGSAPIAVVIPEGDPEAMAVAGIVAPIPSVPDKQFHFLRIGRAIRAEIGDIGDPRADFTNRAGYMKSTNLQTPSTPSFFPNVLDAPFGGTLHIGGYFGGNFMAPPLSNDLYYTVSFWDYTGDPNATFDPTKLANVTPITDPLFNKKYVAATDQWKTLDLGPFDGTITAVDPPHPATLIGNNVKVYKRPPLQATGEYWPFWDLIAIWNSGAAPNQTIVLLLEAYTRDSGGPTSPNLRKLAMDTTNVNSRLALTIDNRAAVLQLFDWKSGVARFTTNDVVATAPFDPCSELPVQTPQADRNECILVKYSIVDDAGNPHPHVNWYDLRVLYTPKQITGAPLETTLPLKNFSGGGIYAKLDDHYTASVATAPKFTVANRQSVLVPDALDGWPPEGNGDPTSAGSQCLMYALAAGARCTVRTVNGWSSLFGTWRRDRHIIVRRA